jgi:hypothetical protein
MNDTNADEITYPRPDSDALLAAGMPVPEPGPPIDAHDVHCLCGRWVPVPAALPCGWLEIGGVEVRVSGGRWGLVRCLFCLRAIAWWTDKASAVERHLATVQAIAENAANEY